ncbi:putative ankyrin repeat protein RF_0381 [Saccostrea echinata]|uniref:putative ankyrin repeat protein RF_0381 n=1 Tax=Saccostrea echinata TaxID=191078 RepID=UPI002A7FFA0C|nr:putative ankyrin repeat protein RF_0381 [Saccostrea echinata]
MLEFLIEKGLDINSTNKNGKTVLHQCCVKGNLYTCKYLVRTYPYLLNVVDNNGNNALHSAACRGDIDLFVFLSEKGLDIDSTRNDGKNVLHICCMNGMIDMCKYLVNTYPHLLVVKDKDGHNVLHDVAWSGNIDLLKFLLDKLDINSARNDGKTVLHLSCRNNKIDMCKYLINTYPQLLDVTDKPGQTALHDAAFGGNIDLLKFLLKKGLDITRTIYDGKTVLHLCCRKGKIDLCECLVKTYSQLPYAKDNNGHSALHDAALGGNVDLIRFLLERGLDINSTRNDGKTVLHLCCMNSMTDMCKYLVKMYPLLLDVSDNDGENVLHDAAWGGDIDILKFLLGKGLDINSTRNDGKIVLHQCCLNGKIDMCKYLVDAYPNLLDITDDSGNNALHAAAWFGNIDLFLTSC